MSTDMANSMENTVKLSLVNSMYPSRNYPDIRFDLNMALRAVKEKIYRHTGTKPSEQRRVILYDPCNKADTMITIFDIDTTLKALGCKDGWAIYVDCGENTVARDNARLDMEASRGSAADHEIYNEQRILGGNRSHYKEVGELRCAIGVRKDVRKHQMDDEEYDKRSGTMRTFIHSRPPSDPLPQQEALSLADLRQKYPLEARCQLSGDRRGCIKHVGTEYIRQKKTKDPKNNTSMDVSNETLFDISPCIGVALDEPLGDTDGTIKGTILIPCDGHRYATWTTPNDITLGDYPPLDPFDLQEM